MPQQMWKHSCPEGGSLHWMGAPFAAAVGARVIMTAGIRGCMKRWPNTKRAIG
jgi:hypothetical protein